MSKDRRGNTFATPAITSGNSSVGFPLDSFIGGTVYVITSTQPGSLVLEGSPDGGTTWFAFDTLAFTATGNTAHRYPLLPGLLRFRAVGNNYAAVALEGHREVA